MLVGGCTNPQPPHIETKKKIGVQPVDKGQHLLTLRPILKSLSPQPSVTLSPDVNLSVAHERLLLVADKRLQLLTLHI